MKRKPLIVGNWKMNFDINESVHLVSELSNMGIDYSSKEVVVAPTFVAIYPVSEILKAVDSRIEVAAQNLYFEDDGPYTGEVSGKMLKVAGANWVIVGHSERRSIFQETDFDVNRKVKKAIAEDLKVIICVGETLCEREASLEIETVLAQVSKALEGINELSNIVIAYEPVWAIGTGKVASIEDVNIIHKAIRDFIKRIKGNDSGDSIRILYGGSVKPENVIELLSLDDVDGALVGGASLKANQFNEIINFDK